MEDIEYFDAVSDFHSSDKVDMNCDIDRSTNSSYDILQFTSV